ncbi:MAG: DUF2288 domain-containing protein [Oleiphilus sp.]|nr:MAG: DUF2288 domain-containing protein [Oleiphilus sp.]
MSENKIRLKDKLNLETGRIAWKDLQTYFASGSVIFVDSGLDLLEVAEQLAADNSALFSEWMSKGLVMKVTDSQALEWYGRDVSLWSVVIKPWVLVQEEH